MNPKQSISYPNLLVYPDGKIFDTTKNDFLYHNFSHGASDGPVVATKNHKGHSRYPSVKTLVTECFVIHRKLGRGEGIRSIDFDPSNVDYKNLELETGKRLHFDKDDEHSTIGWMNLDDIYC